MTTRAPFLTTRFGGYYHRAVQQEDIELTHVGATAPCGEYLRRFWQPVCFTDELRDLPLRVRILGEDLVVFRDFRGAVGLLELHCPHRGTFCRPGYRLTPGPKYCYPCNWLQILENAMDPVHTAFLHTIVSGSQFTDEFGQVPELDFAETPAGMMYMATRRVGENIWVRMVENILPNLQQVAPIWEDGHREHPFSGPMLSRWIVPGDDTNALLIELPHGTSATGLPHGSWANKFIPPLH